MQKHKQLTESAGKQWLGSSVPWTYCIIETYYAENW